MCERTGSLSGESTGLERREGGREKPESPSPLLTSRGWEEQDGGGREGLQKLMVWERDIFSVNVCSNVLSHCVWPPNRFLESE